ncbi:MAG: hypothetical protein RBT87_06265, partial [bacterium]|nr:hypothetical protein [bacterium]
MRKILSILITVVFTFVVINGCAEKKDPAIYDNYPDESETEKNDEGGCGVIPDENIQKPDKTQSDPDEIQEENVTYDEEFLPDSDEATVAETDIETGDDIQDSDIADDSDATADGCPSDMVENGTFCIDKYEASKKDATDISHGSDESVAVSKKSVLPWMVNPMT